MEKVDTKQLDDDTIVSLKQLDEDIEDIEFNIIETEKRLIHSKQVLEKLKERKKSIELYNKKE